MSITDTAQRDRFWSRVRGLLTGHAEQRRNGVIPFVSGRRQPSGRPIEEELQQGWMLAAERNVSLCVLALEIDCFGEYLAAYGRDAAEDCLEQLDQVISALLRRDEDRCLRLGQSGFLLVLPDMPVLMARDLANKISATVRRVGLVNKESHAGAVTLGTGVVVVNPEPPYNQAVLDMARQALRKAQRRGLGRIEIADLRATDERRSVAA